MTGFGKFGLALGLDGLVLAGEAAHGGDVSDGTVQPDFVVVGDITGDELVGLGFCLGLRRAEAFVFGCAEPAFHFAVGLWIVGACPKTGRFLRR